MIGRKRGQINKILTYAHETQYIYSLVYGEEEFGVNLHLGSKVKVTEVKCTNFIEVK